jgi:hypothetical protein
VKRLRKNLIKHDGITPVAMRARACARVCVRACVYACVLNGDGRKADSHMSLMRGRVQESARCVQESGPLRNRLLVD